MILSELRLEAFGPFTGKVLELGTEGLHVVYGPNEAGKSSALRALKALLYGVSERTTDSFLHARDRLRIAGVLRSADGQELHFTRRKGRKNTLLGPQGEVLEEQVLAPFLQGVTAELFDTLFGIDHQALVQGGQEILEQKGEVGQALFSAALGSHAVHTVLSELDQDADALFRPRGSTQSINAALKRYAELNRAMRECSLPSREWDGRRRALDETGKALGLVQAELVDRRTELSRLQRIQRVLPRLARRRQLVEEMASLGAVVVLADDFSARRQDAVQTLEAARGVVGESAPRLEALRGQYQRLAINPALLEQAERIEDLHVRLGAHRKAAQERPGLDTELQQLLAQARDQLQAVRPDLDWQAVETVRPVLLKRAAIAELGARHAVLMSRVELASTRLSEAERRLASTANERDDVPEAPPVDALQRAIAAARKHGDLDAAIRSAASRLVGLQTQSTSDLSRLRYWEGELTAVTGLAVPDREAIRRFESAYQEQSKRTQRLEEKQQDVESTLADVATGLDELVLTGEVPTEARLSDARAQRDALWRLLYRRWVDGEDVASEAAEYADSEERLPDLFGERLADTDEIADRLRREAERVHALASLQARQQAAQRQREQLAGQIDSAREEKAQLDTDWHALWAACRILPGGPQEMLVWLDAFASLRELVVQLQQQRQSLGELERERAAHRQVLEQQLHHLAEQIPQSEELEAVLMACEAVASRLDENRRRRDLLNREVRDREAEVASGREALRVANQAMQQWQEGWAELVQGVGLNKRISPAEAGDFIEGVRSLFDRLAAAQVLQIRIRAIDDEAVSFRDQVGALVSTILPELRELAEDEAVMRLHALLAENRERRTRRQHLEGQVEDLERRLANAQASIQTMSVRLDTLCAEARCDDPAQLEEAERRSAEYLRISGAIGAIEQELQETGEGISLAGLEAEAGDIDPDTLPGRIEALHNRIDEELEPRRTGLAETRGREQKELELMDGSDRAAELADQASALLAGIRADAERYVRMRLAGSILRAQIERYRSENQGPLIGRASEHFAALTLGSFEGLTTDVNDREEPVLVGRRGSGAKVFVDGMSAGTRDQLYLALRFASLERYMDSAEGMPFIVDDILVDFDDERSAAALRAMSALSRRTQVVLFTHHARVVEQAQAVSGQRVTIHRL